MTTPDEPIVRSVSEDEFVEYLSCVLTAFHGGRAVSQEHADWWIAQNRGDLSRRHAAIVDGRIRGTAGAFAARLTVPGGGAVDMAGVTAVTVLATHRRQGLLTTMMRTQLEDAIDRGESTAMLIAAEWPIYGRFGYGRAIDAATTVLDASLARFRDPLLEGRIEFVTVEEFRAVAPGVFDRHRVQTPGAITRDASWFDIHSGAAARFGDTLPSSRVWLVHYDRDGVADGYVVYDPKEEWVHNRPRISLSVVELITASDVAYRDLWRFLASIDWVTTIKAGPRPVDEPLRHLLVDGRAAVSTDHSDHMWVRLLDLPAALSARTYEAPVDLVLDVVDGFLDRGGRFRLVAGPDVETAVEPTTADADVRLGIDALGAAYLGGAALWQHALAGGIEERTPGALARLDAAVHCVRAPWASTGF